MGRKNCVKSFIESLGRRRLNCMVIWDKMLPFRRHLRWVGGSLLYRTVPAVHSTYYWKNCLAHLWRHTLNMNIDWPKNNDGGNFELQHSHSLPTHAVKKRDEEGRSIDGVVIDLFDSFGTFVSEGTCRWQQNIGRSALSAQPSCSSGGYYIVWYHWLQ